MARLRDLYIKREVEPGFDSERLEVTDDLDSTIQQVKMTLFTRKGEVLGEPNFGIDVEKFLFEFLPDPIFIKQEAREQIGNYVTSSKKKDINVTPALYQDDRVGRDILVLLIDLPELNNSRSLLYE